MRPRCAYEPEARSLIRKTVCMGLALVITALAQGLSAQVAERDPFFGEGPRASTPDTVRRHDAADWSRDPFTRPFESRTEAQRVPEMRDQVKRLTGIIFSSAVHLAIVNGEILKEGDMIGDQKLLSIRENSILFKSAGGGTEEITLENFSVRQ